MQIFTLGINFQERKQLRLQHMFYNLYSWATMAFAFHLRIFQPKKPNQLHCPPTFGRQEAGSECWDFIQTTVVVMAGKLIGASSRCTLKERTQWKRPC